MDTDPEKAVFFRQSDVPEHTELAWILGYAVVPFPCWKTAPATRIKLRTASLPNAGLFTYPVADGARTFSSTTAIWCRCGKDQKQHVEICRDLAVKMNLTYGEGLLKVPQARIREDTAVVPGLDGQKMSKSYGNLIGLFEAEKDLKKKIMGIKTDSTPVESPKPTEGSVILALYKLVAGDDEYAAIVEDFGKGGTGYGDFKKRLLEKVWAFFAEAREKRAAAILADKDYVDDVLKTGASKARAVARRTIDRVRAAVGL